MTDVTQILSAIEQGDPSAAEELLPLVYDELRKLATAKMAQEKPGQTLQATGLVHEAYMRLVQQDDPSFSNRVHFFAVAAKATIASTTGRVLDHGTPMEAKGRHVYVQVTDAEQIAEVWPQVLIKSFATFDPTGTLPLGGELVEEGLGPLLVGFELGST